MELTLKSLNKLKFKKVHNLKNIGIDSSPITLDLKFNGKHLSKQKSLSKDYKRAHLTNIKHYSGFQMILAIEQETCKSLTILIHSGSPHDSKIFDDMMNKLKKRKILRKCQLTLYDKEFYSLKNYLIGINKYKIIPLLFSKRKSPLITLIERIQNPLDFYDENYGGNMIYQSLKDKLFNLFPKWENFRRKRWKIEKVFDFLKMN